MSTNAFHIEGSVCYGTECRPAKVVWVPDFDGTAGETLAVLYFDVGSKPAGLYVNDYGWRIVMTYADLSEVCSTVSTRVRVILRSDAAETVENATVFRNLVRQPTPDVVPDPTAVWAVCENIENSGTAVNKPTESTTAGVLQVSAGPGRDIADFAPTEEGVVVVDEDGVASTAEVIELRSGGGLLIGHILK